MAARAVRSLEQVLVWLVAWGLPVQAAQSGLSLLRVQALLYLSTPFIAIPEAITARALDFRRPAFINLIAAIASAAMALVGALSGWGVWTLVFAPMTGFWVKALGYMLVTGFRPIPSFDFSGTRAMILYGASLLGSQLFWIIQSQSDIFIGGRVLTPHQLGLYAEALFLTQIFVSKFIPPLNEVAFPAYARMQKDVSRVAWSFCKAVRLLMLISCPIYLGMAVTAEPLVETLFGQKWLEMAPFVSILALAMPFMTLQVMFAPVSNALGRPGTTATEGSARCLGMGEQLGRLEPGRKADIVFLDLAHINWIPHNNTVNQLVHLEDGLALRHVMVDGQFAVRDRQLTQVNMPRLRQQVEQAQERITRNT